MQKRLSLFNGVLKYTVSALIITICLYPKFPFIRVPNTFVSIRLEDLFMVFVFFIVFYLVVSEKDKFFKDAINLYILIFLLVGFLSFLSGVLVTKTVIPHIAFLHWLRRIEYFTPFFLGFGFIRKNPKDLNFFVKVLILIIFFVFVYGFGQKHFNWPIIITQNEEYSKGIALRYVKGSHINSTFAGHYDLASFLVLTMPIIITSFLLLKGRITKIFLFITWIFSLWLLVNSASRISLISYFLSTVLALVFIKKYKFILLVLVISLLFSFLSPNLRSRFSRIWEVAKDRILKVKVINFNYYYQRGVVFAQQEASFSLKNSKDSKLEEKTQEVFEDRSTNIRLNVEWPRAIRAFSKNPLLGTGYSSISLATDNDYLRLLGEVGILGFVSFFLIFMRLFEKILNVYPFENYFKDNLSLAFVSAISGSLAGVFLNAFFIDVFEASKFAIIFWLIIGMFYTLITKR